MENKLIVGKKYFFARGNIEVIIKKVSDPDPKNPFDAYNAEWISVDNKKSGIAFVDNEEELDRVFLAIE